MAPQNDSPLGHLDLVEVERAAVDLRRGLPVVVVGAGRSVLALSPETGSVEALQAMRGWVDDNARPMAALTHTRAETLKIRLYTESVAAVPLVLDEDPLARAAVLADPSLDLAHPLGGPYEALRDLEGRPLAAAVKIAKVAGLLPSVITIDIPATDEGAARAFAASERLSLATERGAGSASQSQARSALLFLYRHVLRQPLDEAGSPIAVIRTRPRHRIPSVLTRPEVAPSSVITTRALP